MICGATNEECLRSGLQEYLTLLHFIAAAEGLSFFSSKYLIPWTGCAGKASRSSTLFFLQNTPKKLLHKSHQLLRNSIFGSQKLLCKMLTVNSSLYNLSDFCMVCACVRACMCMRALCGPPVLPVAERDAGADHRQRYFPEGALLTRYTSIK